MDFLLFVKTIIASVKVLSFLLDFDDISYLK